MSAGVRVAGYTAMCCTPDDGEEDAGCGTQVAVLVVGAGANVQASSDRHSEPTSISTPPLFQGVWGRERLALTLNGKLGWAVACAICAAYVLFFVRLTSVPLQDYPNHVARAVVMADLLFHHGVRFGHEFTVQLMLVPYILGDLILAACVELFGTAGGTGVFTTLMLLSLPCALLFYMSVNRLGSGARLLVFLLGLYLSTDWFFLMAFMAFRMAVTALVITLALADLLRRRWSIPMFAVYVCALVLSYLTHLAWLVFFAVVLAVSGAVRWWFGTTSVRRELWLLTPLLALVAWHFGFVPPQGTDTPPVYHPEWGGLALKLPALLAEFRGFGGLLAGPLILMLGLCVSIPVRHTLTQRGWMKPAVLEQLAVAAAFLVIYIALPRELQYCAFIDLRALPVIALFLIFAALRMPPEASGGREFGTNPVLALAILLAIGNLAYLAIHVGKNDAWMERYRAVVKAIPTGVPVLSVYAGKQATSTPFLHAGSFVLLDRGGITPYLFGGDHGDPMLYFRYKHRPYQPAEDWYDAQRVRLRLARAEASGSRSAAHTLGVPEGTSRWYESTPAPDWQRVACDYDYMLVTVPFEQAMIGVATHTIASNESAALLKVDPAAKHCGGAR
jgi:hypothetical protein